MAVDISYDGSTIVTLSADGTEILETNGKLLTDDITIAYTSGGGGGGSTTVSFVGLVGYYYYVDATDGEAHKVSAAATTVCSPTVPSGSIIVIMWENARNPDFSTTNMTLVESVNMGSRANYKYVDIYQAS